MNQELEELKNLTREERSEYFKSHKADLLAADLEKVNGGAGDGHGENPDSEVPYKGNYYTSWGFVCDGYSFCG